MEENWATQTEGEINLYRSFMIGEQPVRVLHHMLVYMFQNTNSLFFEELKTLIHQGTINKTLGIQAGNVPIRKENGGFNTPRVNLATKQIELPETFLSYLWACTYTIYTLFCEIIDFPLINRLHGKTVHPLRPYKIEEANSLFAYAKSLIVFFDDWDKQKLPNPERYFAEDRNYVEQTNLLYTAAVQFILCHEFTHLKKHTDRIIESKSREEILEFEIEADSDALELIRKGFSDSSDAFSVAYRLAYEGGIVCGMVATFFLKPTTKGISHPNTEDRLTSILEKLDLDENSHVWGMACIGLSLWDQQFGLNLTWTKNHSSYKELYYSVTEQIKERGNC